MHSFTLIGNIKMNKEAQSNSQAVMQLRKETQDKAAEIVAWYRDTPGVSPLDLQNKIAIAIMGDESWDGSVDGKISSKSPG